MRTLIPFVLAGLLLAAPASAQTSGSSASSGLSSSSAGASGQTNAQPSNGAPGAATQGNDSAGVANSAGGLSSFRGAGSNSYTVGQAGRECGTAGNCETQFEAQQLRLVDSMIKKACPRCTP